MSTPNDGGPAFPIVPYHHGLMIRDYFAAAALQGILAGSELVIKPEVIAEWAYSQADAMLAERSKRNGGAA